MNNKGHFELAEHQIANDIVKPLPVYVGDKGEILPEAESLLEAVKIISETFEKEGHITLNQLIDEVGQLLSDPEQKDGILIENEESISSVRITREKTTVRVLNSGIKELPSELVFDALYVWTELNKNI
jgi:hypothetical protein